jgi:WS/DGAT/MGAT family acyltransferase
VSDPDIDLDYHVRHLGLPRPGTMQQLEELVGRLHSNFLDRSRPLWEFYVIDGLADGQVAVYTKMHHAAVDGGAGMALTQVMYDTTPVPREVEPPPPAAARSAEPDAMTLIGAAYRNFLSQQIDALKKLPDVMKAVADLSRPDLAALTRNVKRPPQLSAPKTMLNVSVTSQRAFTAFSLPLDAAKAIARQTESKLNEVVLAISAGALRRYLKQHDNLPKEPLMAMVPVSLREPGNTETNNQVSAMLCSLATDIADPLQRPQAIREASAQAKQFTGKIKDATPRDFSIFGAPLWIQGMASFASRARLADNLPPQANVVISNVPGPQSPLYLAGSKMMTLYPVSIPAHGMALNITVQSYCGALDFGLTACRRSVPELRTLAGYLKESFDELCTAVGMAPAPTRAKPAPAPKAAAKKVPAKKAAATKAVTKKAVAKKAAAKKTPKKTVRSPAADPTTAGGVHAAVQPHPLTQKERAPWSRARKPPSPPRRPRRSRPRKQPHRPPPLPGWTT